MTRPIHTVFRQAFLFRHWRLLFASQAIVLFALGYLAHRSLVPPSRPAAGQTARPAEAKMSDHEPKTWTCVMHLHIRRSQPGKCPICSMDLVPVDSTGGGGLRELTVSPEAKALMNIKTTPVERRYVTAEIRMVGKVDYDETRLRYITAWVPGRLDRLFVDFTGVKVNKGDHMVEIYSPELYEAQDELIMAASAAKEPNRRPSYRADTMALLESAREKLRLWGMTAEQISEIEQQEKPTDHVTVYAPMGGIVIHKNRQEGDYVKVGERIYTVADLSWVWVKLDAYESDLPWLHYGQTVTFMTEAYPGETFEGRVVFEDPVLDPETRTVKVRVNVPNAGGKLKPEMFVRGVIRSQVATEGRVMDPELAGKWISPMHPEIIKDEPGTCDICGMPLVSAESLGYVPVGTNSSTKPLVIPVSAALVTGTRAIVYVELSDTKQPTYEGREILLGPKAGDYYIVRRGLAEGEMVVTNGNFKIDSALQIQAKPSVMNPEGGGGGGAHQHDHGGKASAGQQSGPATAAMIQVPLPVQNQIRALDPAFKTISDAVRSRNLERIRAAFNTFDTALRGVDSGQLSGHEAMLWKEFAMLLGNDALEGAELEQLNDAYRVFNLTANHMRRMRERLLPAHAGEHGQPPQRLDAPAGFQKQLTTFWGAYTSLGSALATDDLTAARDFVEQSQTALEKIDMRLVQGEAHQAWMTHLRGLKKTLEGMHEASDLESIRTHFAPLSNELATVVTTFGLAPSETVYKLHCPMAFDNQGANWLQQDDQVRNPYFGSEMLTCADRVEMIAGGDTAKQEAVHHHEQ